VQYPTTPGATVWRVSASLMPAGLWLSFCLIRPRHRPLPVARASSSQAKCGDGRLRIPAGRLGKRVGRRATQERLPIPDRALSVRPGRRSRPGPGRTARASTTGRGSRSGPAGRAAAGTGCWPAGPYRIPTRSPTTPATGPAGPAPPTWPGRGQPLAHRRSASSRPRARPGWIGTRSAPGAPGTPTSPCPCSPWPGSPPARPRPKKGGSAPATRHDRLHVTGDPPPADQPDPGLRTRP
jgi:hypothetical protein